MDEKEVRKLLFRRLVRSDVNLKIQNMTDDELDSIYDYIDTRDKSISNGIENISFGIQRINSYNDIISDSLNYIPITTDNKLMGVCIINEKPLVDNSTNQTIELLPIEDRVSVCEYDDSDHKYKDKFFSKQNIKRRKIKNKKRHR